MSFWGQEQVRAIKAVREEVAALRKDIATYRAQQAEQDAQSAELARRTAEVLESLSRGGTAIRMEAE